MFRSVGFLQVLQNQVLGWVGMAGYWDSTGESEKEACFESLESFLRVRIRFQLGPSCLSHTLKRALGHKNQGLCISFKLQIHNSSSLSAPALSPCAEYQGSPSIGFSRFYGCTPLCSVVCVCVCARVHAHVHTSFHTGLPLCLPSLYCLTLLQWEPQGNTA